eukprot:Clim_evm25s22 gene=Clim_evmTU25s22
MSHQSRDMTMVDPPGPGSTDTDQAPRHNWFADAEEDNVASTVKTSWGKWLVGGTAGLLLTGAVLVAPFVSPVLRKHPLPYVPAGPKQIEMVLDALRRGNARKVLDIGSGDGRVVIAAAKAGYQAEGVELNRPLVYWSKWSAFRSGVSKNTRFYCNDLWKFDISTYDHIVVFGVKEMMSDLERKMAAEMMPNGTVIACRFKLATWKPNYKIVDPAGEQGIHSVWIYRRP